jgi:hypothetical protein
VRAHLDHPSRQSTTSSSWASMYPDASASKKSKQRRIAPTLDWYRGAAARRNSSNEIPPSWLPQRRIQKKERTARVAMRRDNNHKEGQARVALRQPHATKKERSARVAASRDSGKGWGTESERVRARAHSVS